MLPLVPERAALRARAFHIAEPIERGLSRLRLAHAARDHFAASHLEVEVELRVDLFVDARPPEAQRKALAKIHGQEGSSTFETALANRAHSCVLAARRFLPAAVIL